MSQAALQNVPPSGTPRSRSVVWTGWMLFTHCVVGVLLIAVLVKMVPEFVTLFQEFDADLPRITVHLITVSHLAIQYWYLFLPVGIGIDAVILFGLSRLPAKTRWLGTLWSTSILVVMG